MSKNKSDLVMAYAVKRKSNSKPTVVEAPQADAELVDVAEDYADEELWADMPDEEPEEQKETSEARVARIMQNFRLSNLGNKNDD